MPSTTKPRLLLETVGGVTVASFADAELVDDKVVDDVSEQLDNLAIGPGLDGVVLNFREVRFMTSEMLAVLFKFSRKVGAAGGKVKLCCIAPSLMVPFKLCKFERVSEIFDQESAAIDSF